MGGFEGLLMYDKENKDALFMDKRKVEKGAFQTNWNPNWCVNPEIIADFRNIPFKDTSIQLVVNDLTLINI